MEQELLTLPEDLDSTAVFYGFRVTQSLVVCVVFCRSLFFLLSLLSALFRFTASDFQAFLNESITRIS